MQMMLLDWDQTNFKALVFYCGAFNSVNFDTRRAPDLGGPLRYAVQELADFFVAMTLTNYGTSLGRFCTISLAVSLFLTWRL
jgi:hypothetical protein